MKINYGLIAVLPDESKKDEDLEVLHFCGYEKPPSVSDLESLYEELRNDEEFGLTEVADGLVIIPAPKEVLEYYRDVHLKLNDEKSDF